MTGSGSAHRPSAHGLAGGPPAARTAAEGGAGDVARTADEVPAARTARDVPAGFTYREVGATRRPEALPPPGFHLLRATTRLGRGPAVWRVAGQAVLDWRMHRAAGAPVDPRAPEAAPGVAVTVGLRVGPARLRAPCRVVWAVREPERVGFAYGTLPGHPACGEESFLVELLPDATVWLTVTAFSRAAAWYTRAAGPAGRAAQRWYGRRYGRVLRRLCGG